MKTNRFLSLLIVILLLAIAGTIALSYNLSMQAKSSGFMVEHTQEVLRLTDQIQFFGLENEAASRGFAITGKKEYEQRMDSTSQLLILSVLNLKAKNTYNRINKNLLDSMLKFSLLRAKFSDTIRSTYLKSGQTEALALISTGRGLSYSQQLYKTLQRTKQLEDTLLAQRRAQAEMAFHLQRSYLMAGMVVMLMLAGAFVLKLKKDYRQHQDYQNHIVSLNHELERKVQLRTAELAASKRQLEDIFYRITDAFIALDGEWRYIYLNENACRLIGKSREEVIGKNVWQIFPDAVGSKTYNGFHEALEKQVPMIVEDYYAPLNLWQENHIYPSPDGISVVISDISERKKLEQKLQVAQRMYFFVSHVNQSLVRVEEEQDLMSEICKIAVEIGGLAMAWVGMVNSERGEIIPVAHAGHDEGYLSQVRINISPEVAEGQGPVGKAVRSRQFAVCNDIASDPCFVPWRSAALERGYLSCVALPLTKYNKVIGVFCVYAPEKNFFNANEIKLLEEASGDISFGLERFETEKLRKVAERNARKEKELADTLINSMPGIVALYANDHRLLRWNRNLEQVTGYSAEEIRNLNSGELIDPAEADAVNSFIYRVLKEGEAVIQANVVTRLSEKIPFYISGTRIQYEGQTCILGIGIDFSELVNAQGKLQQTTDQLHQLSRHLFEVRELERKRIGREIHDELGQQLTAIKMDISWMERKLSEGDPLREKMNRVIDLLNTSNRSIRRILNELRPSMLDDYGLDEALKSLNSQFFRQTGIPVDFEISGIPEMVPEPVTTCIYRVYQEALTNITRYAGARQVKTKLEIRPERIMFSIRDDGTGFDPQFIPGNKSFGILGMRERVAALHGRFYLHSRPGGGTHILLEIPFE